MACNHEQQGPCSPGNAAGRGVEPSRGQRPQGTELISEPEEIFRPVPTSPTAPCLPASAPAAPPVTSSPGAPQRKALHPSHGGGCVCRGKARVGTGRAGRQASTQIITVHRTPRTGLAWARREMPCPPVVLARTGVGAQQCSALVHCLPNRGAWVLHAGSAAFWKAGGGG